MELRTIRLMMKRSFFPLFLFQFDIDEYLVPMGDHKSIHPVLDKLDEEGKKIISFGSWRAWPRRRFIE